MELPAPTTAWAITKFDPDIQEKRVVGIYSNATDANIDAIALQTGTNWVEVEPWLIHNAPQWSSANEPAWETKDGDFDVVVPE